MTGPHASTGRESGWTWCPYRRPAPATVRPLWPTDRGLRRRHVVSPV